MESNNRFLLAALMLGLVLVSGCIEDNGVSTGGVSPVDGGLAGENIAFIGPLAALEATEGYVFSYSFCNPFPSEAGATCGGLETALNPVGGKPPYSFAAGYGAGLLPAGMRLNLNGLLEGIPSIAGTYDFEACAKDASGNEDCELVQMVVSKPLKLEVELTGSGYGNLHFEFDRPFLEDCGIEGFACFMLEKRTTATITPQPSEGSILESWSGECLGTGDCVIFMDEDKHATATFSLEIEEIPGAIIDETPPAVGGLANVTIDSAECKYLRTETQGEPGNYWHYDYFEINASGTASGPVGTELSVTCRDAKSSIDSWTGAPNQYTFSRAEGDPETTTWSCYVPSFDVYREGGSPTDVETGLPIWYYPSITAMIQNYSPATPGDTYVDKELFCDPGVRLK